MPRGGRSSGRSSTPTRSSPSMTSQRPSQPAPTQQKMTPAPTPTTSSGSGFFGTIMQGMAFGAGSEVGHQAIRSVFGGSSHNNQPAEQPVEQPTQYQAPTKNYCETENMEFISCLKNNSNSISMCQPYLDVFKECEKKYKIKIDMMK